MAIASRTEDAGLSSALGCLSTVSPVTRASPRAGQTAVKKLLWVKRWRIASIFCSRIHSRLWNYLRFSSKNPRFFLGDNFQWKNPRFSIEKPRFSMENPRLQNKFPNCECKIRFSMNHEESRGITRNYEESRGITRNHEESRRITKNHEE